MYDKSAWEVLSEKERGEVEKFASEYMEFITKNKTEREVVKEATKLAEKWGLNYRVFREKAIALFKPQGNPVEEGIRIVVSHIDAPRIDLKPNPVFENKGFVLFKTHYYGGIKKYQWLSIPLAIHGIVIKKDGRKVDIVIGEDANGPVITIPDLLPHLANKQMDKKASEFISGENLTPIIGSIPGKTKENKIKKSILDILKKKYGIVEEDFVSAEFEIVPAWGAREVGIDGSLIGSYGQDDRVCAYTSMRAIMNMGAGKRTPLIILYDKEEIGSYGNTGATSRIVIDVVIDILEKLNIEPSYKNVRKTLSNSSSLSADVNAAINPLFPEVMDESNGARLGYGIVLTKYTGHRGKGGSNDAHAELMHEVKTIFDENNVHWQVGELGKVDEGGGGTVALYMAQHGINTVDCGVPILAMHSPFEISSKVDVYEGFKAYRSFLEN